MCKAGGREPAPQRNPPLQLRALLLTTATPSAQLLAPRGRLRGDRKKAGLGQRTALCPSAAETHLGTFHMPSWAFSQNRGCQGGFSASPSDRSSITCSTRLLLASSSPKPDWAAATLRGLGHIPVLCLPTQGEKSHTPGQGRRGTMERKGSSKALSRFLPFGRKTESPIPPMPCSQSPHSTQL